MKNATCCGVFSILMGVELISLQQIIFSIVVLSMTSSKDDISILGVVISPVMQISYAAWALLGIPAATLAAVGALYKIEWHLYLFAVYLGGTMLFNGAILSNMMWDGELCGQFMAPEVRRLGEHFVCGFIETFAIFWLAIGAGVHGYYIYVMLQAATLVRESHQFPELLKAAEKLHAQAGYSGAPPQMPPMPPMQHQVRWDPALAQPAGFGQMAPA